MPNGVNNNRDNDRGDLYVIRGLQDPSIVATKGARGTIFIRVGDIGGTLWQKQDEGVTTNWTMIGGASTDQFVRVSGADLVSGYLTDKLITSTGITGSILNPGADEDFEIELDTVFTDARYFTQSSHISTGVGVPDAGKPIILNASGIVDLTLLPPGAFSDINAKVSAADTTTGFLNDKLVAGTGIASLTILNPGADEDLEIALDTVFTDGRYYTQASFINLSSGLPDAGKPIVLNVNGKVDNSMLPAAAFIDENVKVSGVDTTPGFLSAKIVAGSAITLTILNPGADEDLEIAVDATAIDHGDLSGLGDDDHPQYALLTDLASNANALGASLIGIEDSGGNYVATEVEAALAEIAVGTPIDHGGLQGLLDDDHTQYVLRNILTTKGDLFAREAGAINRVGVGADGTVLAADSAVAPGVAWKTPVSVDPGSRQIDYSYGNNSNPYIFTASSVYLVVAEFIFPGTTVLGGTLTDIRAIFGSNDAVLGASIRVFDQTNALVIAELTGLVSVPRIIASLGAIMNVPAGEALFEIQMKRDAAGAQAQMSALSVFF
jgi:hypothetical protein